jgi:hypothetical protein
MHSNCSPLGNNIVPRRSDFVFAPAGVPRTYPQAKTSGITTPTASTLIPAVTKRPLTGSKTVAISKDAEQKQKAPTVKPIAVEQKPNPPTAAPGPAPTTPASQENKNAQELRVVPTLSSAPHSLTISKRRNVVADSLPAVRAIKQSRSSGMIAVHDSAFTSLPMPDSQPLSFIDAASTIDESSIAAATILCLLSQHPLS